MIALASCTKKRSDKSSELVKYKQAEDSKDSLKRILVSNLNYFNRNLLHMSPRLLLNQVVKYIPDSCVIQTYPDSILKDHLIEPKSLGDLNGDKVIDKVFVLPPFTYCDEGQSYYFTDISLPRLFVESYCANPDLMFPIGDINEDGIIEICIFYSSCVSRYKSLRAFTLKNNQWLQIGLVTFDINFSEPAMEGRVRKVSKGKFEMLEIIEESSNSIWKKFSM